MARSLGERDLYRRTGVQLMPINTIFQLAAHDRSELDRAARLLMLPELVAHELTGEAVAERSNAGTTGLLDLATGTWASDLAEAVGVAPAILPAVEPAGRLLGEHRGVPVHLVAAHDTACAVAASPLGPPDRGFVSAGTWFLVGVEREAADTSETARVANFSNEPGALGGYRFLKNVPGFWLLERCAADWGIGSAAELLDLADGSGGAGAVFDVRDDRFLAPERMEDEVRAAAGLPAGATHTTVVSSIVRSIAAGVAAVVDELRAIGPLAELAIVGGARRVTGGEARARRRRGRSRRHGGGGIGRARQCTPSGRRAEPVLEPQRGACVDGVRIGGRRLSGIGQLRERAVDLDPVPLLPPEGSSARAQLVPDAEEHEHAARRFAPSSGRRASWPCRHSAAVRRGAHRGRPLILP